MEPGGLVGGPAGLEKPRIAERVSSCLVIGLDTQRIEVPREVLHCAGPRAETAVEGTRYIGPSAEISHPTCAYGC